MREPNELERIAEAVLAILEAEVELSRLRQRRYEEMAEAFGRMAESLKPDGPGPTP